MKSSPDKNNSDIQNIAGIFGYCVQKVIPLEEINSFLYLLEHTDTGARHAHISNNDKENAFGVAFKTVPSDSTGVAHILEHTVLCGSHKFPVHDPFFSMLKRSLNTFMNAFTSSDWTMYPFSTQNRKDFYNLMDVYLDSAFYPNIKELSFKQEGYRIEIETAHENTGSVNLVYKGVVYNEMKGAMSSPNQVMARSILNALYPETTYSYNSGGDPAVIPRLTYDQLKSFHRRHYHPSNAFFYTYGDLPLKDHLDFINKKILKHFKRINPKTDVPRQPRWQRPRIKKYHYPLDRNEDPKKKCQVCVAWLTADIKDAFEILVLAILEEILLGNAASPLRKALIDSNLGASLSDGTGFDGDNRDTTFVCGLKDVAASDASKIETIIFDVLRDLWEKGINKQIIESAIHQIEFRRKEITNTPYPYGIKLLLTFAGSWFHGGDPEKILKFDDDLKRLRTEMDKGPFLEDRIHTYFLENPHRVLLTLVPDQTMEEKERERVEKELERILTRIKPSEIEKIKKDAKALQQLQEGIEDVSCLPTLAFDDIPPSIDRVKAAASYSSDSVSCYSESTSGIFYFMAAAGSGLLSKNQIPLVPLFCHAFTKIGTSVHNYEELARLIDAYTGGMSLSAHAHTGFEGAAECLPFISFNGKCLARNQENMFEIIEELLTNFEFSDKDRLKSLLLEYQAGLESMVIQNGHRLAMSLAARNFSLSSAMNETWSGIHQLQTIKTITQELSGNTLNAVSQSLREIGKALFVQGNLKIALIGEEQVLSDASSAAASILKRLNTKPESSTRANGFGPPDMDVMDEIPREGWSTSSAVSFVAGAFETVRLAHEDAPVLSVISKIIRSMYLHREIREKGGAYGGFAIYSPEDGIFYFGSYRDPHIVSTLKAYDGALNFIRSGDFSDEDIKEAVLQVCSEIDKPDPPGPAAKKAFFRQIVSLSDDMREHFKKQLLSMTRKKVLNTSEKYFAGTGDRLAVAVISNEEKLKAANKALAQNPLKLFRI
jgi:Zn-dependent M16 (insulinase) family peptidase